VSAGGGVIYVYDNPLLEWQSPNQFVFANGEESFPLAPLAIEDGGTDLYFQVVLNLRQGRWQGGDHAGRALNSTGPDQPNETWQCNEGG
jgi:hypothetical protein